VRYSVGSMWFASVVSCDTDVHRVRVWSQRLSECLCQCCDASSANSVVPVFWCFQCKQRCASVVVCSVQTALCKCCGVFSANSVHQSKTSNQGPRQEELRTKCIVKTKTVPYGTLVFEGPSAGGWDGYSQQIRYAIASARSYHISPAPGCPW
jgi:hypothetical protein